jgi:hypothetical protein
MAAAEDLPRFQQVERLEDGVSGATAPVHRVEYGNAVGATHDRLPVQGE